MSYPIDQRPRRVPTRDPIAQHANATPRNWNDEETVRPVTVYVTTRAVTTVPHYRRLDSLPYNLVQAPPEFLNPRQGATRSDALRKTRIWSEQHMHPRRRRLDEAHRRISSAPDSRVFEAPKTYSDIQDQHGQVDRRPPPPQDAGLGKGGWKRPVTNFPQPLNAVAQRPRFSTSEWVDAPQLGRQRPAVDLRSTLKRGMIHQVPPKAVAMPVALVSSTPPSIVSTSRRKRTLNSFKNFGRKILGQDAKSLDVQTPPKAAVIAKPKVSSLQPASQPNFPPRPSRAPPLNVAWNSRPAPSYVYAPARSSELGGTQDQSYEGRGKGPANFSNAQPLPSRQRYRMQYPPSVRKPFPRRTASQPPFVGTIVETGESDTEHGREDSTNASAKSGDDDVPLTILQCNALARRLRMQRGIPASVTIPPRQDSTSTAGRTFVSLAPAAGTQLTRQSKGRFTLDSAPDSVGGRENMQGVQRPNSQCTIDSETGSVASQRLNQGTLQIANPIPHDLNSCICPECRELRVLRRYQTCNFPRRTEDLERQMTLRQRVPLVLGTQDFKDLATALKETCDYGCWSRDCASWQTIVDEEEWFKGLMKHVVPLEVKVAKLVAQHCSGPEDSEAVVEEARRVSELEEAGPDVQCNANAGVNECPTEEPAGVLSNVESKAGLHMPPPEDDKNGNEDSVLGAWIEPKYFGDEDF
ncbi:hypothetical protein B0A48_09473 [Cryoendolithus antarcticus]|uniref:Uncharacterized protein n=1 Tax=Cryoendolithus antarcticus TaxID=1507870 RepID=A0A1V8SZV5_9PEZI|nr:hypothetical protein B0A48_09473 [Cryoendolithus antarcticus]